MLSTVVECMSGVIVPVDELMCGDGESREKDGESGWCECGAAGMGETGPSRSLSRISAHSVTC